MNWKLTQPQQTLIDLANPPSAKGAKPRLSNMQLLQFIADKFRDLGGPPRLRDLDPHRAAIKARFGGFSPALRRAADQILSAEERERLYVWRCREGCDRTFNGGNGRAKHERYCKGKVEI